MEKPLKDSKINEDQLLKNIDCPYRREDFKPNLNFSNVLRMKEEDTGKLSKKNTGSLK